MALQIIGSASAGDLVIDTGLDAVRSEFTYNAPLLTTGGLTDLASQLFGTSADTLTAITIATDLIDPGDFTAGRFGFVLVPVPAAVWLLATGLIGLAGAIRRGRLHAFSAGQSAHWTPASRSTPTGLNRQSEPTRERSLIPPVGATAGAASRKRLPVRPEPPSPSRGP